VSTYELRGSISGETEHLKYYIQNCLIVVFDSSNLKAVKRSSEKRESKQILGIYSVSRDETSTRSETRWSLLGSQSECALPEKSRIKIRSDWMSTKMATSLCPTKVKLRLLTYGMFCESLLRYMSVSVTVESWVMLVFFYTRTLLVLSPY